MELSDDDVISTELSKSLSSGPVFKVKEAHMGMINHLSSKGSTSAHCCNWFGVDGVRCEVLKTTGGGWQKGKIRFRLEFIPDEPPQVERKDPFENM
jgi:KGK domain